MTQLLITQNQQNAEQVSIFGAVQLVKEPLKQGESRKFERILSDPRINPYEMAQDARTLERSVRTIGEDYGDGTALAFGSLVASDVRTSEMLESARGLDGIVSLVLSKIRLDLDIKGFLKTSRFGFANSIFNALNSLKSQRFMSEYSPISESIARLNRKDPNITVGNCLDLTIIDNIVLSRFGYIPLSATNEEFVYGEEHHVHTRIKINGRAFDIDNIYRASRFVPQKAAEKEVDIIGLISMVYLRRGKSEELAGNLKKAEELYSKSIELFPNYLSARECRAYVRFMSGNYQGAIEDSSAAININPSRYTSFNMRASARYQLAIGLIDEGKSKEANVLLLLALSDLNIALELAPNYNLAKTNRSNVEWTLKNLLPN